MSTSSAYPAVGSDAFVPLLTHVRNVLLRRSRQLVFVGLALLDHVVRGVEQGDGASRNFGQVTSGNCVDNLCDSDGSSIVQRQHNSLVRVLHVVGLASDHELAPEDLPVLVYGPVGDA